MSLYVAKIRFKEQETICEIPLRAQSEDEAIAYLNSSSEWVDDGSCQTVLDGEYGMNCGLMDGMGGREGREERRAKRERGHQMFSVVGVVEILDPRQSPFRGDIGCWNAACQIEEVMVGAAFYDTLRSEFLKKTEDAYVASEDDTADDDMWDDFSLFEKELINKFDLVRFDGVSLEQALLLANGSTDAVEVEPSKMRAAARVLAHKIETVDEERIHAEMMANARDEISPPTLN